MGDKLRTLKITNPFWLGQVTPFVKEFTQKVPMPGVTYESFYTFLAQTVQHGQNATATNMRDGAEFWVVFDGNKPIAFARWYIKPLPAIGVVSCDVMYSWNRAKEPARMLMQEFAKFGIDHHSTLYEADATNETVFQVLKNASSELGYESTKSEQVNFTLRKKDG